MFELPKPQKVFLKDKLDEATAKARANNPALKLVRIFGTAVEKDGGITLGQQGKFLPRWEYAFMDDKNGEAPPWFLTVLYLAPKTPLVTPNAGNVGNKEAFLESQIPQIKNSDAIAATFNAQPGFKPLGGFDNDTMVMYVDSGLPVLYVSNWNGNSLRLDPFTMEEIGRRR